MKKNKFYGDPIRVKIKLGDNILDKFTVYDSDDFKNKLKRVFKKLK